MACFSLNVNYIIFPLVLQFSKNDFFRNWQVSVQVWDAEAVHKLRESCWLSSPYQNKPQWRLNEVLLFVDVLSSGLILVQKLHLNKTMDAAGEDEPDPIKLKSLKDNKTFTVPQNYRVRERAPSVWVRSWPWLFNYTLPSATIFYIQNTNWHNFTSLTLLLKKPAYI